jgi:hypothetical protein
VGSTVLLGGGKIEILVWEPDDLLTFGRPNLALVSPGNELHLERVTGLASNLGFDNRSLSAAGGERTRFISGGVNQHRFLRLKLVAFLSA